jgi:hypothetical protein
MHDSPELPASTTYIANGYSQALNHNYGGPFPGATPPQMSTAAPRTSECHPCFETVNTYQPRTAPREGWEDVLDSCIAMFAPYQQSMGPARSEPQTERSEPYTTRRSRPSEHINAEAGPSTLPAPLVPYVEPSTLQPTRGISETTADAERGNTTIEEDKASVSSFYCSFIPRVTGCSFGIRRPKLSIPARVRQGSSVTRTNTSSPGGKGQFEIAASGRSAATPGCVAGRSDKPA